MRQTKTKSDKSAKRCASCGAKMWMWDDMRHRWIGEYHFQDCIADPGNTDLIEANTRDKMQWESEQWVPREKGRLILKAIGKMLDKHNTPEQHEQYKRAILAELKKVEAT